MPAHYSSIKQGFGEVGILKIVRAGSGRPYQVGGCLPDCVVQMYGMCTEHANMCTAFVSYFCGMTATRQNRTARAYTFTFDSEAEKEAAHAHAKRRGTNLANLLKMLLTSDMANNAPVSAPTTAS
jgi:hypothetical protein